MRLHWPNRAEVFGFENRAALGFGLPILAGLVCAIHSRKSSRWPRRNHLDARRGGRGPAPRRGGWPRSRQRGPDPGPRV